MSDWHISTRRFWSDEFTDAQREDIREWMRSIDLDPDRCVGFTLTAEGEVVAEYLYFGLLPNAPDSWRKVAHAKEPPPHMHPPHVRS